MFESLFNKVAANQGCSFSKIRLQNKYFLMKICKIFKNTYLEKHLPADASINERQEETNVFLGKKNVSQLANISRVALLSYLTSVALLFNFIPLDYEFMVVA